MFQNKSTHVWPENRFLLLLFLCKLHCMASHTHRLHSNLSIRYCFRFDNVSALNICRLLLPDYIIFAFSVFSWIYTRALGRSGTSNVTGGSVWDKLLSVNASVRNYVLPYLVLVLLLVAGISKPCLISSVYFLLFLLFGSLWSLHKTLHTHYRATLFRVRLFLMIYSGSHLLVLYFYQFQFFQSALPVKSLPARWVGYAC